MRHARRRHEDRFGAAQGPGVLHPRLLFVDADDLGRSAFAAGVARAALAGCRVESAGLDASAGERCPESLVGLARAAGVDLSDHRSTPLTRTRLGAADVVLVLDMPGYARIAAEFPWAVPRTTLLGLFATPPRPSIGHLAPVDDGEAQRTLDEIAAGVAGLAAWIRSP